MSKPYYSILTNIGENLVAKATALGTKLDLTTMAVGDGNGKLPAPDPAQIKLVNEKRRAAVNSLEIDKNNPNIIIVEHIIPETEGGWWVREIGLFDSEGNLIAVGNCPETYKPKMIEGSGRTQIIRMMIVVKSTECIELKSDPSVVLATREYVDGKNEGLNEDKFDKGNVTGELGASKDKVINQEVVTKLFGEKDTQIAKVNNFIPASAISTTNKKIVVEVVDSEPSKGNGYINTYRHTKSGFWIRERIVTGGYSGDGSLKDNNCPVWRLGQLFIVPHLLTLKQALSDKSENVNTWKFVPDQFIKGDGKNQVSFYQISGNEGEFVEFTTSTKEKEINILFAATSTTDAVMTVEVYLGNTLISTEKINTLGTGEGSNFNTYIGSIRNPRPSSLVRVKVIKGSDRFAYIAGINANFDNHVADDIDKLYWSIFNKTQLIRPTQTGAMCYVFKESTTGLFGGESHGGETPLLQKIYVDNVEAQLIAETVFSCESFRVVQETQIKWNETTKIDCFTEHRFNGDGTHEFIGSFLPSDNFYASAAYCPMLTVDSNYFRRVTFPESIKMDNYPDKSSVTFNYAINKFEIQGKDNAFTTGLVWSSSLNNNKISNLLVKPYGDNSTKLYAGPVVSETLLLKPFSIHQFRYYF